MAFLQTVLVALLVGLAFSEEGLADLLYRRFEYKHSFKGPHLVDRKGRVPFWNTHGSTIPSEDQVRLTPSIRSKKGALGNNVPFTSSNWEVEMKFRVTGNGRVGADGLVMWLRDSPIELGPVFGASDAWKGLGIFFDTFDNDGLSNNPYIMVMINNGLKSYDHSSDGIGQQVGGCQRDFRNRPYPVRAKVVFYNGDLTVFFDNGNTPTPMYDICVQAKGINLPNPGYFGLSSATGGLADDHDILSFLTTSISSTPFKAGDAQYDEAEVNKFQESYDEYSVKLEEEKQKFAEHNPDRYSSFEQYETPQERDIRMAFEGQEKMRELIMAMKVRIDALQQTPPVPAARRDGVLAEAAVQKLTAQVNQLLNKQIAAENVLEQIRNRPVSNAQAPDFTPHLSELNSAVNHLQAQVQQLRHASTAQQDTTPCEPPQCASSTMLFGLAVLQFILFGIFFLFVKQQQAAAAKKFF